MKHGMKGIIQHNTADISKDVFGEFTYKTERIIMQFTSIQRTNATASSMKF